MVSKIENSQRQIKDRCLIIEIFFTELWHKWLLQSYVYKVVQNPGEKWYQNLKHQRQNPLLRYQIAPNNLRPKTFIYFLVIVLLDWHS